MSSCNAGIAQRSLLRTITGVVLDDDLEGRDLPVTCLPVATLDETASASSPTSRSDPANLNLKTENISTADETMLLDVLRVQKHVPIADLVDLARRLKYTSQLPFAPTGSLELLKCAEHGLFVHGPDHDKKTDHSTLIAQLQEDLECQTARVYSDEVASSLELARIHIFLISCAHRVLIRCQAEHEKQLSRVGEAFDRSSEQAVPSLDPLTRVGLKALCSTAVLLISTCQTHNPAVISHVINIADEALSQLPALALSPLSFSADMMSCLQPLFDYMRSIRDASDLDPQLSHQMLVILLRMALLRGSVAELLDSAHSFLDAPVELASTEYSVPLHAALSDCDSNPLAHKMSNASNNCLMLTGLEASVGILHILDQGARQTLVDSRNAKPVLIAFQPMAIELKMCTIASLYRLVLRAGKYCGFLSETLSEAAPVSKTMWETLLTCAINLLNSHLHHFMVAEKAKRPMFQLSLADRTRIFNLLAELSKNEQESESGSKIAILAVNSISQCCDLIHFNPALQLLACREFQDNATAAQASFVRSLCRKFGVVTEAFSIVDCVLKETPEKAAELWSKIDSMCFVWLDNALMEWLSFLGSGRAVPAEIDEAMKVVLSLQEVLFSRLGEIHSTPRTINGIDVLIPWAQHWSQGCLQRVGIFCQQFLSVLRAESDHTKIRRIFNLLQQSHFNRLCTTLMSDLTFGFHSHIAKSHELPRALSLPMAQFALNIAPDTLVFVREVLALKSVLDATKPARTDSACTSKNQNSACACKVCEAKRDRRMFIRFIEKKLGCSSGELSTGSDSDSGDSSFACSVHGSDHWDRDAQAVDDSHNLSRAQVFDLEQSDADRESNGSHEHSDDENDNDDSTSLCSSENASEGQGSVDHDSSERCDRRSESIQSDADDCESDASSDDQRHDDGNHESSDESTRSSSRHSSDNSSDSSSDLSSDFLSDVDSESESFSNSDSDRHESSNHSNISDDSEDSQPLESARVRVFGHRHMLRHVRHRRGNADCDRCGDSIDERSWYCGRCSYDLCLSCFEHRRRRRAREDRCKTITMRDCAFLAVLGLNDYQEGFAPDADLVGKIKHLKSLIRDIPVVLAEFISDFQSLDYQGMGRVSLRKLAKLDFVKQHIQIPPGSGSVKMTDLLRFHLCNETKSAELKELLSYFDLVDCELSKFDFSHINLKDCKKSDVWFSEEFARHATMLASSLAYSLCIGDDIRENVSTFSLWQRTNLLAGGLNMNSRHRDTHNDIFSALKIALDQNRDEVDLKEESDTTGSEIHHISPFLLSIINNTGPGAALLEQFTHIRDTQIVQLPVRSIADESVRLLFAVLVHHFDQVDLAEVEAARSDCGEPNKHLAELWHKSFVARDNARDKYAEYYGRENVDEFLQLIRQRSFILLRFTPAISEPSFLTNTNDPPVPTGTGNAAYSNNVLLPCAPSFSSMSTFQSGWIKVKRLLKKICTLGRSIDACFKLSELSEAKQRVFDSSKKLLTETVLMFITSNDLDVNGLMTSCRLQHKLALKRVLGLQTISWLLSISANHQLITSVLVSDITSRTLFDGHYFNGLNAAGAFARSAIQEAYYSLAQAVVTHNFACGLRFLITPLTPFDLIQIHKSGFLDVVLDTALQVPSDVSMQTRFSAFTATRLISYTAVQLLSSAIHDSQMFDKLQSCADFLVSRLIDSCMSTSAGSQCLHDSVSLEQSAVGNLYSDFSSFMDRFQPHLIKHSSDSQRNQLLWMLLRICDFDRGRQIISTHHNFISNLLQQLLSPSSDSTVVLICRLLRQLLPCVKQSDLQSIAFDSPTAVIDFIFTAIKNSLRISTIRSELIYLLRYIASACTVVELNGKIQQCSSSVDWMVHIADRLRVVLKSTANCQYASETLQSFYDVVEVLGGHLDRIREGASVSFVEDECKMQGILMSISNTENSGEVSVDESTCRTVKFPKLTAIDNVDVPTTFPVSLIVHAIDVISSFLASQRQASDSSILQIIQTERVCWTAILRLWSVRGSQLINFLNRDIKTRLLTIMSERSVQMHEMDSLPLRTEVSRLFELLQMQLTLSSADSIDSADSVRESAPLQWLIERGGNLTSKIPVVAYLSKKSSKTVSVNKNRISNFQFSTAAFRSTQSIKVGMWLFELEIVTIPVIQPDARPLSIGLFADDKPHRYEEGDQNLHTFNDTDQLKSGDRLVCCVDALESGLIECTFFLNNKPFRPAGCSVKCSKSHSNHSICLRCSQQYELHSGHDCPDLCCQRGSFPDENQVDSKLSFDCGRRQLFAFVSLAPGVVVDTHFSDFDIQFKQESGSAKTYFAWHQQQNIVPQQAPPYPFAAWSDIRKVDDHISQMMEAHSKADSCVVLKCKELSDADAEKRDLADSKLGLKKWSNFHDVFSVLVKWNVKLAEILSKLLSCGSNTVVLERGGLLKIFRSGVEFESHFDSIGVSNAIVWVANQREHRIHISATKFLSFECNQDSVGPDFEIFNSNAVHHVSVWRFALTPAQVSSVFAFDVQKLHADLADSPTSSDSRWTSWWNSEDPASAWSVGRTVLENSPSFKPACSQSFDVIEMEPGTYFCTGNSTETTGKFPVSLTSGVWYYECMLVSRNQNNQGNQGIDISSGDTNVNIGFAHSTFVAEASSSLGMSGSHAWAFDINSRDWCFEGDRSDRSDRGSWQSLGDSVGIIADLESPSREFWLVMSGQFFGPLSTNFSLESGITPHVSFKSDSGVLVKFSAHNMKYFNFALHKFPTLRPIVFGEDDGNAIRDLIKLQCNPNSLLDPSVFHKHRNGAMETNWTFTNRSDQSSCIPNSEGHLVSCSNVAISSLKADQSVTGGCWVYQAVMKKTCRHRIGWCVSPRNSSAKCGEDELSWGFDCEWSEKYHDRDYNDWGVYGQAGDTVSAVCSFEDSFVEFAYFVNDRCIGVAYRSTSVNSPLSPFMTIGMDGTFQLNCCLTSLRFLSDIRKFYPKVLPIEVPAHLVSPLGLDVSSVPSLSLMKFPISWLKQAESAVSELTIQEILVNCSIDSTSQTSSTSVVPYVSMLKSKSAKIRLISDWLVVNSSRLATEDKFSRDVSLCKALLSSKHFAEIDIVNAIVSSRGNHMVALQLLRHPQSLINTVSSADVDMIKTMLHKVSTISAPLQMVNHQASDWRKIGNQETQTENESLFEAEIRHNGIGDLTLQNFDLVHSEFEQRLQVATARRALLEYFRSAVQHADDIEESILSDVSPHSADETHASQPLLNVLMRFVLLSNDCEEIEILREFLSSLVRKFSSSSAAPAFFEAISDELFAQLIFLSRDTSQNEPLPQNELAIVDCRTSHAELLLFLLEFVINECKHTSSLVSQLLPTRILCVLLQLPFPRISSQTALKVTLLQHVVSVISIPMVMTQLPPGLIEDLGRVWFEMTTQLINSEDNSYLDKNSSSSVSSFRFSSFVQAAVAACILIASKCQTPKPDWLQNLIDGCVLRSFLVATSSQNASSSDARIYQGKLELLSVSLQDAFRNYLTNTSDRNAEFLVDNAELVALINRSIDSGDRIQIGEKLNRSVVLEAFSSFVSSLIHKIMFLCFISFLILFFSSELYSRLRPFAVMIFPSGSSVAVLNQTGDAASQSNQRQQKAKRATRRARSPEPEIRSVDSVAPSQDVGPTRRAGYRFGIRCVESNDFGGSFGNFGSMSRGFVVRCSFRPSEQRQTSSSSSTASDTRRARSPEPVPEIRSADRVVPASSSKQTSGLPIFNQTGGAAPQSNNRQKKAKRAARRARSPEPEIRSADASSSAKQSNYSETVSDFNYRMGSQATNMRDMRLDNHIMGEVFHNAGRGAGYDASALRQDTDKHAGLTGKQEATRSVFNQTGGSAPAASHSGSSQFDDDFGMSHKTRSRLFPEVDDAHHAFSFGAHGVGNSDFMPPCRFSGNSDSVDDSDYFLLPSELEATASGSAGAVDFILPAEHNTTRTISSSHDSDSLSSHAASLIKESLQLSRPLDAEVSSQSNVFSPPEVEISSHSTAAADAATTVAEVASHIIEDVTHYSAVPISAVNIEPASPAKDKVSFSAFAPPTLLPSEEFALNIWAYLVKDRKEMLQLATVGGYEEKGMKSNIALARDTEIDIVLVPHPDFEYANDSDTIVWGGDVTNAAFGVTVKSNCSAGNKLIRAQLTASGKLVGQISVSLKVVHEIVDISSAPQQILQHATHQQLKQADAQVQFFRSVYACHSAADRFEVMHWVNVVKVDHPDLRVDMSVADKPASAAWSNSDAFTLFWSEEASKDTRIDAEWRAALRAFGPSFIHITLLHSGVDVALPLELHASLSSSQVAFSNFKFNARSFSIPLIRSISSETLSVPTQLSRRLEQNELKVMDRLSEGHFGVVHRGEWRGCQVAIKQIPIPPSRNASAIDELLCEAQLHERIKEHAHVVRFYGSCVVGQHVWLISEFCAGGSLRELLNRSPLSIEHRFSFATQTASGLWHLHSERIVHRDVAARNLLVSADGSIKVTDFGLSRILMGDDVLIPDAVGTFAWMAPESLSDTRFSSASDMYAFGMVLFELWTCRQPFDEIVHPLAIRDCVLHGQRPALDFNGQQALQELYQQCVDADPNRRITAQRAYYTLRGLFAH